MLLTNSRLGYYQLLSQIGDDEKSVVYLAQDTHIPRQVAVKVIHADELEPSSKTAQRMEKLFQHEMEAIMQLVHPHILPVLDFGRERRDKTTYTYVVMPYQPVGSLSDWLKQFQERDPLSLAQIAGLLAQAAGALQYAHTQKVLHHNIKPSNFLLRAHPSHPGELPYLFLADFDPARFLAVAAEQKLDTHGSPRFLAPEQWAGKTVPASDQYALATMAFRLLTGLQIGQLSFPGSVIQLLQQHYAKQPPTLGSLNPRLNPAVDDVIMRALAREPSDRFPSVQAFAQAFVQILSPAEAQQIAVYTAGIAPQAPVAQPNRHEPQVGHRPFVPAPAQVPIAQPAPGMLQRSPMPAPPGQAPGFQPRQAPPQIPAPGQIPGAQPHVAGMPPMPPRMSTPAPGQAPGFQPNPPGVPGSHWTPVPGPMARPAPGNSPASGAGANSPAPYPANPANRAFPAQPVPGPAQPPYRPPVPEGPPVPGSVPLDEVSTFILSSETKQAPAPGNAPLEELSTFILSSGTNLAPAPTTETRQGEGRNTSAQEQPANFSSDPGATQVGAKIPMPVSDQSQAQRESSGQPAANPGNGWGNQVPDARLDPEKTYVWPTDPAPSGEQESLAPADPGETQIDDWPAQPIPEKPQDSVDQADPGETQFFPADLVSPVLPDPDATQIASKSSASVDLQAPIFPDDPDETQIAHKPSAPEDLQASIFSSDPDATQVASRPSRPLSNDAQASEKVASMPASAAPGVAGGSVSISTPTLPPVAASEPARAEKSAARETADEDDEEPTVPRMAATTPAYKDPDTGPLVPNLPASLLPGSASNQPLPSQKTRPAFKKILLISLIVLVSLAGSSALFLRGFAASGNTTGSGQLQSAATTLPGQTSGGAGGITSVNTSTPAIGQTPRATPTPGSGTQPTQVPGVGPQPTQPPAPVPTAAPRPTPTPTPHPCLLHDWNLTLTTYSSGGHALYVSAYCNGVVFLTLTAKPASGGHEVDFQICYALHSTNCSGWVSYTSPNTWRTMARGLKVGQVFYINARCKSCTSRFTLDGAALY